MAPRAAKEGVRFMGAWADVVNLMAVALAVFGVVAFVALWPRLRGPTAAGDELGADVAVQP